MKFAVWFFAIAAIAVGAVDIIFGAFDGVHQPVQALDGIVAVPHYAVYIVGGLLVLGGVLSFTRPGARVGGILMTIAFAIFALFWVPRLVSAPQVLGLNPAVLFGVLGGFFQQAVVAAAAFLIFLWGGRGGKGAQNAGIAVRLILGLGAIVFGLVHFTALAQTASMVPGYFAPSPFFWATLTGLAFVAAGAAILARIGDVWAARATAVMLAVFSIFVLAPYVAATPHGHGPWAVNAYNLSAIAAFWLNGAWLGGGK